VSGDAIEGTYELAPSLGFGGIGRFQRACKHQPTASACTDGGKADAVRRSATVPAFHGGENQDGGETTP
jgi:hypothetical protein